MPNLSIEQLNSKIDELTKRHGSVNKRKAELGGELKAKRDELGALVKEVQEAGFNPKTLVEDRNKAQEELEALVVEFEKSLVEAETSLQAFDKNK